MVETVTRFAPSPTGYLHLGHAYSALFAHDMARMLGGRFILRIEDIDPGRCRDEFEDAIYEDLRWLGLTWEEPVLKQSAQLKGYGFALQKLAQMDLVYPCFCTRKEIAAEIERAGHAPHPDEKGADGPPYPGTCRKYSKEDRRERFAAGDPHVLRLDMLKAMVLAEARNGDQPLTWMDSSAGIVVCDPSAAGDVVLARKDIPTSYHLAVTIDDALQDVSLVTRGQDLFSSTHVHRLLQALLGLPVPRWQHHRLIVDDAGKRLAKRDAAHSIRALRKEGAEPEEVRALTGIDATLKYFR